MKVFIETINGFDIYFEALDEHIPLSGLLPEDTPEQLQEVADNNVVFCAKISAEIGGVEFGCDYLGGCIYESYEDFYKKYKNDYYSDMVDTAIKEAHPQALELAESIKKSCGIS